ncbi:MAG: hypothetical protein U9Q96_01045 [Patescibacteria group bacterium]|nr:hypothetical protein [Patescibacteria group bacterium]
MDNFLIKKGFFLGLTLALFLGGFLFVPNDRILAEEISEKIEIYFFHSQGCPHCADEAKFLIRMEEKYPKIIIHNYDSEDPEGAILMKKLCKESKVEKYLGLVPMTFVGSEFFLGFDSEEGMGKKIENAIRTKMGLPLLEDEGRLKIPFLGEVNPKEHSLFALAVILGLFDGFNVCSLGVIVLILGMVLAFKSRKKTLILGGTFLLTTGIIYGVLIFLWYQFFSILGSYLRYMEIFVGFLALFGAVYFFRQFIKYRKQGAVCEVGESNLSQKLNKKLKDSFKKTASVAALAGSIIIFAAIITVIEFPCSAYLPVIFAGALAQADLSSSSYLIYLFVFILFYMLDEIVIFLIAVWTRKIWIASGKFMVAASLVASIVLLLLGLYYFFGLLPFNIF